MLEDDDLTRLAPRMGTTRDALYAERQRMKKCFDLRRGLAIRRRREGLLPVLRDDRVLHDPRCKQFIDGVAGDRLERFVDDLLGLAWTETTFHYSTGCLGDCHEQTDDRIRARQALRKRVAKAYDAFTWRPHFLRRRTEAFRVYDHLRPCDAALVIRWINDDTMDSIRGAASDSFQLHVTMLRYRLLLRALTEGLWNINQQGTDQ